MAMEPLFNNPLPPGAVLMNGPAESGGNVPTNNPLPPGATELPAGATLIQSGGGDSSFLNNLITGAELGASSESFTASLGNIVESYLPAGRIGAINPATGKRELWQSTASALGKTDEEWDKMTPAQRKVMVSKESQRQAEASADEDSIAYGVGRMLGMVADPTSTIPWVGGRTVAGRMAFGGTVGAADMATYSASQEGQVDPTQVALGAVGGAAIPAATKVIGTGAKALSKGHASRKADKMMDAIQFDLAEARKTSENSVEAFLKLGDKWTDDQLEFAIENSRKSFDPMRRKGSATAYLKNLPDKKKNEARRIAGKFVNPLSQRFKKISPKLAFALRNMDRKALKWTREYDKQVKDFTDLLAPFERSGTKEARKLTQALLNRDDKAARDMIKAKWGDKGEKAYDQYKLAEKRLFQRKVQAGLLKPTDSLENYTPRWVKDYNLLKQKLGQEVNDFIDELVKTKEKKIGRTLTQEETNDIYNKYLQGYYHKKPKVVKNLKSALPRRIVTLEDDLLDAYSLAHQSIHSDIRSTMDTISRRDLFGKTIVNEHGDNLTDGINAFVREQGKDLSHAQLDELRNLLTLRFVEGSNKPHQAVQGMKNFGYMSMLGNPVSALTQIGDLAFSVYKYNVMNTTRGLISAALGRGLTPKEMGLMESMAEEFVSSTRSKRWLDGAFKYSGFKQIDALGKTAIMNGALKKYANLSVSETGRKQLAKKWKDVLGDKEFNALVKDFQSIKKDWRKDGITDRMKAVAFSELSDIQPITLLEMPEMYLKHPNGRMFYMLKTFALKHLDFMRQEFLDDLAKLETYKSPTQLTKTMAKAAYLSSIFTAFNVSSDAAKSLITGKDPDADELMVDNALKNIPLFGDKYLLDKIGTSRDPATIAANQLMPPWSFLDPGVRGTIGASQAMLDGDIQGAGEAILDSGSLRYIPLVGRVADAWVRDN